MDSTAAKIIKTIGMKNINKVFQIIRSIYMIFDYILISTFGYSLVSGWENDRKVAENQPNNYGHLMLILGRFSHDFAATVASENFIFRHDSYVDPIDFVLNNDNVVLMGVSPTQVTIEEQGILKDFIDSVYKIRTPNESFSFSNIPYILTDWADWPNKL